MLYTLCIVVVSCLSATSAQVPIPNKPDGFVYGSTYSGQVVLEGFFDLMCPDCKAAWPVVKQVVEHYGAELQFRFHTFPLPYHRYAYYTSQGAHILAAHNASEVYTWLEAVFDNQVSFGNTVTADLAPGQVISRLAALAQAKTTIPAHKFSSGIWDSNLDWATRVSWKYGCSRYVSGTPTFLLNGVQVEAEASWTLSQWRQLLDPLFLKAAAPPTCPQGRPVCEYLPGKVECCLPGEACIPNVGCRCANTTAATIV